MRAVAWHVILGGVKLPAYVVAPVIWLVLVACSVERPQDVVGVEAAPDATATVEAPVLAPATETPVPAPTSAPPMPIPTAEPAIPTPTATAVSPTATVDVPTPASPTVTPLPTATPIHRGDPVFSDYQEGFFAVVDNPALISAAASTLRDDDLVMGYEQNGEARAYPVGMAAYHHIFNDTFQGTPLLVTY